MRKGFVFAGLLLVTITLSYLFYRSCKRDTLVIAAMDRVAIPDSSWLYGSFNLEQTKKDIAWSTVLNGDFNKIFQTDTNTNTLFKLLRSPDTYSITEQHNIRYFAALKDSMNYTGLLFALTTDAALKQSFKSDSFTIQQKKVYSFRTAEGIWLFNSSNLLFVSGASDSLAACSFFTPTDTLNNIPGSSEHGVDTLHQSSDKISLISGNINTLLLPAARKQPLLDSALLSFDVWSNDEMLDISWTYKGFLTEALNQSFITHQNNEAALLCMANLNVAGIKRIFNKIPSLQQTYLKQKITVDPFLTAVDNNNLTLEFNGWKKIKNSYYVSVLNDEFETVLQKKDSSIIEPIFKISLEQKNKTEALNFLSYLQKKGLVSNGKQPFAIIYGNFDSELSLDATYTLTIHNKHTSDWASTPGPEPLDAALLLQINPSSLKGLSDSNIDMPELFQKFVADKKITYAGIHVKKEKDFLTGSVKIKFTGEGHPFIELIKNSGQ